MNGSELRIRIDKLQVTYRDAAKSLGLSEPGLHLQMRGLRKVSHQTELLLKVLENRSRLFCRVRRADDIGSSANKSTASTLRCRRNRRKYRS